MSANSVCRSNASNSVYRTIAEDCLRKARTTPNDHDKPFWLNLAQSWLQLAERSAREAAHAEAKEPPVR